MADRRRTLVLAGFGLTALALALRHLHPTRFALLWDDALFFRRIAHNLLRHGFAGFNQADGPAFVATSQLFQLLATLVLAILPQHYNVGIVFCAALALTASAVVVARAALPTLTGAVLVFFLLQAPPAFLSVTTGMETAVVILVTSFVAARLVSPGQRTLPELTALQLLAYLARPDAVLLSLPPALLLAGGPKRALLLAAATLAALGAVSAAFFAYYGTALPLATFLKLAPFSIYDAEYLRLGRPDKLRNLLQLALVVAPLVPLALAAPDRRNGALGAGAAAFVGFHALTTTEIVGYHARFYAPALPLVFAAALRGLANGAVTRRALLVSVGATTTAGLAYAGRFIETAAGYGPDIVPLRQYAVYFLGVLAVLAARELAVAWRERVLLGAAAAGMLLQLGTLVPRSPAITADAVSDVKTIDSHRADVGIDIIKGCFREPLTLLHSEIGLPGVLLPESRIIDVTGLANLEVVRGTFDFEAACRRERPEFVFRPHRTHRRLNRVLDESACLRDEYELAPLARPSSCPLYVRRDLAGRFAACGRGGASP